MLTAKLLTPRRFFSLTIILLLLVAILPVAARLLRVGGVVMGSDFGQFYIWEWFTRTQLSQGVLPLWNPYSFAGYPFQANPQTMLFYPPAVLLRIVPLPWAFTTGIVLHLWWLGVGWFVWLQRVGVGRLAALSGALAGMLAGYVTPHIGGGHLEWLYTVAWLPWLFATWHAVIVQQKHTDVLGLAAVAALMILAGGVKLVMLTALLIAVWTLFAIWQLRAHGWRALAGVVGRLTAAAVISAGLSAVQLLPTLQFTTLSNRTAQPLSCYAPFSFTLPSFAALVQATPPFDIWLGWDQNMYVGAVALVFAVYGLLGATSSHKQWWEVFTTTALIGIGLGLGPATPLYGVMMRVLPVFGAIRQPFTFVVFLAVGMVGLAAIGIDSWLAKLRDPHSNVVVYWLPAVLALAAGAVAWAIGGGSWVNALPFVFALLLLLGLAAWRTDKSRMLCLVVALVSVQIADLSAFTYRQVLAGPPDRYEGRAHSFPHIDPLDGRIFTARNYQSSNATMYNGTANAAGYAPLMVGRYINFASGRTATDGCFADNSVPLNLEAPHTLDLLSIRILALNEGDVTRPALPRAFLVAGVAPYSDDVYALSRINAAEFNPARVALIADPPPDTLPDALLAQADVPAGTAIISAYTANAVVIAAEASRPALLILTDVWYPGWHATVNDQPVPLLRANVTLRAVVVPAGSSEVTMRYRPPLLLVGSGISLVSLLLIMLALATAMSRERGPGQMP